MCERFNVRLSERGSGLHPAATRSKRQGLDRATQQEVEVEVIHLYISTENYARYDDASGTTITHLLRAARF